MPRDSASPPHGVGLSKAQDQNQETVSLVLAGASPVLSAPTQGSAPARQNAAHDLQFRGRALGRHQS